MINKLSKELIKRKVYHKIQDKTILTRKTKVSIPKINKDIAYLIGVIAGDGSLVATPRKRGGYHYILRIYAEKEEYLKLLNKIFEKHFLLKGGIKKDKRKRSAYYLLIQNASIFFYFVNNGSEIGKKQRFKIPKAIQENRRYFLEYLAGLVDTDGHIARKRVHLKQKSEVLLREINKLANKEGLNCNLPKVNYTNEEPYYYIRFDNKIPLRFKTNKFLKG
ncbi:MAG: LAGLIDADG family homing endonuclease [Candidatus Pacearchaeota archaeon]|jgi:hypothetical protein